MACDDARMRDASTAGLHGEIPEELMALVRTAQLSGGFCPERAIASAIRRERQRCRSEIEAWRAGLAPGEDPAGSIGRLLALIGVGA